jgi:hypothetical protein
VNSGAFSFSREAKREAFRFVPVRGSLEEDLSSVASLTCNARRFAAGKGVLFPDREWGRLTGWIG